MLPDIKCSEQIDRQEFTRSGFLVLEEFLDAAVAHDLTGAVESLKADGSASRVRRGTEFARRNLLECQFVRDLIAQPSVNNTIQTLAPGLVPVRAILFDKTGSANWTVPWHQDRSIAVREKIDALGFGPWSTKAGVVHVQPPAEILHQMLTLRFHLDACGQDNGPLRVIAGTHARILNQEEVEDCVAIRQQTVCTTDLGGLVIMRPLILHASSPATRPSHRRVIHIEFGARSLPFGLSWSAAVD